MSPFATLSRAIICCVACFGLAVAGATAQHVTVSFGAIGGLPHSDFQDELDRVGFGVSGSVLVGYGPVAAGIEASSLTYDYRARPLQTMIDGRSAFLGEVTTASRIGGLHAVLRLQMPEGPIQPYVDGLVGFQRFATTTDFEQTVLIGTPTAFGPPAVAYTQHTRSLQADDVALSYGVGGGILFRLTRGVDAGVPFEAFLDLGARYILGEEATYRPTGVVAADGTARFETATSRTDIIRPQISLVVKFGR